MQCLILLCSAISVLGVVHYESVELNCFVTVIERIVVCLECCNVHCSVPCDSSFQKIISKLFLINRRKRQDGAAKDGASAARDSCGLYIW